MNENALENIELTDDEATEVTGGLPKTEFIMVCTNPNCGFTTRLNISSCPKCGERRIVRKIG